MLGLIDYLVMATYLALLVVIGVRALKAQGSPDEYFLGGRSIKTASLTVSGSHLDRRGLARRYGQSCLHARHFSCLVRHCAWRRLHLVRSALCSESEATGRVPSVSHLPRTHRVRIRWAHENHRDDYHDIVIHGLRWRAIGCGSGGDCHAAGPHVRGGARTH